METVEARVNQKRVQNSADPLSRNPVVSEFSFSEFLLLLPCWSTTDLRGWRIQPILRRKLARAALHQCYTP